MTTCVTCGDEFTVQRGRVNPGLRGECYDCGRKTEAARDVSRHVGLVGGAGINKSNAISVFRNPTPALRAEVRRLNSSRFGANLPLGNPAAKPLGEKS